MSGQQLCPESSKGMKERSSGSRRPRGGEWFCLPAPHKRSSSSPSYAVRTRLYARGGRACQSRKPGHRRSQSTRYRPESGLGPPRDFRLAVAVEAALQCPRSSFWNTSRYPPGPETQPLAPAVLPIGLLAAAGAGTRAPRTSQFPAKTARLPPRNRSVGRDFRELRLRSRLAC
jgi:hypothetical protein